MLSRVGGALSLGEGERTEGRRRSSIHQHIALHHTNEGEGVHVGDVVNGHKYHGIHGHANHHSDPLQRGEKGHASQHKLLNASHMVALTAVHIHHSNSHTDLDKLANKSANVVAVMARKMESGGIVLEHGHEEHGAMAPVEMHKQGNLELYTEGNMAARQSLRHHKDVEAILDQMWVSAARHHDKDNGNSLDKEEYRGVHQRMLRACIEQEEDMEMSPEEMEEAFDDDWEMDSGGDGAVDKHDFLDSVFQLTDTWCETGKLITLFCDALTTRAACTVELDEYTGYLKWLQTRMFGAPDRWFNFKKTIKFTFNKAAYKNYDHKKKFQRANKGLLAVSAFNAAGKSFKLKNVMLKSMKKPPLPYVAPLPPPTRLQVLSRPCAKRQQDAVVTRAVINYHARVKPRPFFETTASYDSNISVKYRAPKQQPALKSGANLPAYGSFRPLGSGVARTVVGFGGGRTARRAPHESVYRPPYSHKVLYPCTLR
jgi:hypothetical protein